MCYHLLTSVVLDIDTESETDKELKYHKNLMFFKFGESKMNHFKYLSLVSKYPFASFKNKTVEYSF